MEALRSFGFNKRTEGIDRCLSILKEVLKLIAFCRLGRLWRTDVDCYFTILFDYFASSRFLLDYSVG